MLRYFFIAGLLVKSQVLWLSSGAQCPPSHGRRRGVTANFVSTEVMNKNSGSFLRLKENEEKALHECLTWGSLPGNNAILRWQCCTLAVRAFTLLSLCYIKGAVAPGCLGWNALWRKCVHLFVWQVVWA